MLLQKVLILLEKEIATSKEPARSILESIAAQMYLNYFQQNRYKLYGRTNTVDFNKKDIATWTADDLQKKSENYTWRLLKIKHFYNKQS